ncbi:MAG: endopeptidase La, partial [Leptospiraceae bacterium]|nr:endopeptidase La [Leptospiraceae bacterium]
PLLDRMEIISLSGYILEEKREIAKRYLIPEQIEKHGLKKSEIDISEKAITQIIDRYAREAGVRNLENQIKKILRKVSLKQIESKVKKIKITPTNLEEFLGKPIFTKEVLYNNGVPGVALGLAYTSMGGATLYIEATAIPSKSGIFHQTGQLGDVMRESSQIAYSFIKAFSKKEKDNSNFFDENSIHLHVPAGATPKDGPSAGITMALALYSLFMDKPVRNNIAMTGELTLTGKVLPIGGVREKTIGARRVGIFELIFPIENKKDFDELPDYIKEGITPHFVNYFSDVLDVVYRISIAKENKTKKKKSKK